eukprot:4501302-Pleurochrysis_carterae.AAC.2
MSGKLPRHSLGKRNAGTWERNEADKSRRTSSCDASSSSASGSRSSSSEYKSVRLVGRGLMESPGTGDDVPCAPPSRARPASRAMSVPCTPMNSIATPELNGLISVAFQQSPDALMSVAMRASPLSEVVQRNEQTPDVPKVRAHPLPLSSCFRVRSRFITRFRS